tara:strand:+ start:44682 stop:44864 length:183 start_codon:yes stop_codon:yes gene_type:complete
MVKEVNCKKCGTRIKYILMEDGKVIPVNMPPKKMVVVNNDKTKGAIRFVSTSHLNTCTGT